MFSERKCGMDEALRNLLLTETPKATIGQALLVQAQSEA
jgi:hypothetical protein